jgi:hypothetical protein
MCVQVTLLTPLIGCEAALRAGYYRQRDTIVKGARYFFRLTARADCGFRAGFARDLAAEDVAGTGRGRAGAIFGLGRAASLGRMPSRRFTA